jgi:hypothetical protein
MQPVKARFSHKYSFKAEHRNLFLLERVLEREGVSFSGLWSGESRVVKYRERPPYWRRKTHRSQQNMDRKFLSASVR